MADEAIGAAAADAAPAQGEPSTAPAQQPAAPAAQPAPAEQPLAQDQPVPTEKPAEAQQSEASETPAEVDVKAFKMPEGVELDTVVAEAFAPVAKDLGLNQEQAQKLADFHAQEVARQTQLQAANWQEQQGKWQEATKSDAEFGGEKFDENLGLASKALDKFGTPELKEALVSTGAGNHPEFVRLLYRVGKAMGEDGVGAGLNPGQSTTGDPEEDRARRLYPNHN